MKILLLGMNYAPEVTGIGPYSTELAEHLASIGHEVSVVTAFPHFPQWRVEDSHRGRITTSETRQRVKVHRVWHFVPRRHGTMRRVMYDTTFTAAAWLATRRADADVVLSVTPPAQLPAVGLAIRRRTGAHTIAHVQDLVGDIALNTRLLGSRASRAASEIETSVLEATDQVTVITEGFKAQLVARGIPSDRITVIPNWIDQRRFAVPSDAGLRARAGAVNGDVIAMYAGNIGGKQGLETVAAAARVSSPGVRWVIVGDGHAKAEVAEEARGVENCVLMPLQPSFPATVASADILLLMLKPGVADAVMPSKLLGYMAAGKPVIASVENRSLAAEAVRDSGCGLVVAPGDAHALAEAAAQLRDDAELRAKLGASGRNYVSTNFGRDRILEAWQHLVEG